MLAAITAIVSAAAAEAREVSNKYLVPSNAHTIVEVDRVGLWVIVPDWGGLAYLKPWPRLKAAVA